MLTICLLAPSATMAQAAAQAAVATAAVTDTQSTDIDADTPTDPPVARLSADEAAREILRRHGGRVLAVQPDGLGYRVKVLKNGEVRIYQINP